MTSERAADDAGTRPGPASGAGLVHDAALLTAVFEALPELVFLLDRDGHYVDVLGGRDDTRYHDGRALIGSRLHDVLPEDRADEFLARIREALDTGDVVRHEYRLSVHDVGGVDPADRVPDDLWFEGRAAPISPASGRDDLVVWLAFNVTESRQAALELRRQQELLEEQTARLEELSRARQRLLSVVSHDLRGPLTAIRGFLELLAARGEELEPARAEELLRRGAAQAARMDLMIADMLTASRIDNAELAVEPRAVSVAAVVGAIVGASHEDDDPVEVDLAGVEVWADPSHLERILDNLLDNARKYGSPPVEVSAHRDGSVVHLRVRDHGAGVAAAFVPQLFDAFSQAHPTPADRDGIGLGLSIVQQLTQANGGTVDYEPTDDGACFVVTLPAVTDTED